jgi:hypothetical protein
VRCPQASGSLSRPGPRHELACPAAQRQQGGRNVRVTALGRHRHNKRGWSRRGCRRPTGVPRLLCCSCPRLPPAQGGERTTAGATTCMRHAGSWAGAARRAMVGRLWICLLWAPHPSRCPLLALPQVALQAQQPGQVKQVALAKQADVARAQRQGKASLGVTRPLSGLGQHLPLPGVAPLRPGGQQRAQLLLTCGRAGGRVRGWWGGVDQRGLFGHKYSQDTGPRVGGPHRSLRPRRPPRCSLPRKLSLIHI